MSKAPNEKLANKVDCELYRIISRVEDAIDDGGKNSPRWREARFALVTARGYIRSMMSDADRKSTM